MEYTIWQDYSLTELEELLATLKSESTIRAITTEIERRRKK